MAMNQNGRGAGRPDESRPSYRAHDQMHPRDDWERGDRWRDEDDRRFDRDRDRDRFAVERSSSPWMGSHWEDDRDEAYHGRGDWMRDRERYGAGERGYGARRGEDRGRWDSHNRGYGGIYEDRQWASAGPAYRGGGNPGAEMTRYGRGMGVGQQGMPGYGQQSMYGYGQQGFGPPEGRGHRGKGPKNFTRSDDRIREAVCEALSDHDDVDASEIEVAVKNGEVTLTGSVEDRQTKRAAEDCVERVAGVRDVQNQLRVQGAASGRHRT